MEWIKIAERRIKVSDLKEYYPLDHFVDLQTITTPDAKNYTVYYINYVYTNLNGIASECGESFETKKERDLKINQLDEYFLK